MQSNLSHGNSSNESKEKAQGVFPVLLMALALVIWFSFQLAQTLKTRDGLIAAINNLEPQVQAADKIKTSLSALATGTKQLANYGNPNAAQIVKSLAQRGINIADPNMPQQLGKEGQGDAQKQQPQK